MSVDTTPVIAKFSDGYRIGIVQAVENILEDRLDNYAIYDQFSYLTVYDSVNEVNKALNECIDGMAGYMIEYPKQIITYKHPLRAYCVGKTYSFTNSTQISLRQYKGWRPLIEKYFDEIKLGIKEGKIPYNFRIEAVKEKYGRFDTTTSHANDYALGLLDDLEQKSMETCIECGGKGDMRDINAWMCPYCDLCHKDKEY